MNRKELLEAMTKTAAAKPLKINVEGWGDIFIKPLTVGEVQNQKPSSIDPESKRALAIGAAKVMCDETGQRIFNAEDEAEIALIESQPWPMLHKVISAADKFNGLGEAGEAEAKKG